jgi:predicted amidophosphoribosyltransferase
VLEEVREPEDRRDLMATLPELVLKDSCTGCGATLDLYGSSCRHLTLCVKCGKSMAETAAPCSDCGVPITRLIRVWSLYPFSTLSFFLFHLPHNRDAARKLRLIMFGV